MNTQRKIKRVLILTVITLLVGMTAFLTVFLDTGTNSVHAATYSFWSPQGSGTRQYEDTEVNKTTDIDELNFLDLSFDANRTPILNSKVYYTIGSSVCASFSLGDLFTGYNLGYALFGIAYEKSLTGGSLYQNVMTSLEHIEYSLYSSDGTKISTQTSGVWRANETSLPTSTGSSNWQNLDPSSASNQFNFNLSTEETYSLFVKFQIGGHWKKSDLAIAHRGLATYNFTVKICYDKTAPSFSVNDYYKAGETISATITEPNFSQWYLDGAAKGATKNISLAANDLPEGAHTIRTVDLAGNATEKSFIVDKTAPTVASAVANGSFINAAFSVGKLTEANWDKLYWKYSGSTRGSNAVTATSYDGVTTDTSKTIAANATEGWYSFIAVDKVGYMSAVYWVCLDRSPPVLAMNQKDGGAFVDGQYISRLPYFGVTEQYGNTYTFTFAKKTVADTYGACANDWSGFTDKPIYYDNRLVNFSTGLFSRTVFYTQDEAKAYVRQEEYKRIASMTNWSLSVSGTIIASETQYAIAGSAYFKYTKSDGTVYLFFDRARLNAYIETLLSSYISSSSYNYFFEEGDFRVTVTDSAGNVTVKYFTLDLTVPTLSIPKTFFGRTDAVNITVSDTNFDKLYLDGSDIGATRSISALSLSEGTHTLRAVDNAENYTEVTFTVDLTAPVVSLSGGKTFYKSGDTVTLSVTETRLDRILLDGNPMTAWANLAVNASGGIGEGVHSFTVYDKAGNSASISFTVDFTAPTLTTDKDLYALADTITVFTADVYFDKLYLDNVDQGAARSFLVTDLSEGIRTFRAVDKAGNSTIKTVTLDKTPPTFTLKAFYNLGEIVELNVTETYTYTVTLDGVLTTSSSFDFSDKANGGYGSHVVVVTDLAGNVTEKSFFYGTSAPKISLIKNGSQYTGTVYIKAGETITLKVQEPQYNRSMLNGFSLTLIPTDEPDVYTFSWSADELSERTYIIQVIDNAQNVSTIAFVVDKTAPELSVKKDNVTQTGTFYLKNNQTLRITATDINLAYVMNAGEREECSSSTYSLSANSSAYADGLYTVAVYDKAGNFSVVTFIVDKTAPTITADKNGTSVLSGAFVSSTDIISFVFSDMNAVTVKLNGNPTASTVFHGTDLADGVYTVTVTDLAENTSTFSFTIDKTAPLLSLRKNGSAVDFGAHFRAGNSISVIATESYREKAYLDDTETSLTLWNASDLFEGEHTYTVYDKAGNYTSLTFTVDKAAPIITLNKAANADGKTYFNADDLVILDITELHLASLTINGGSLSLPYFDASAYAEGQYTVTATDVAGNSTSVTIYIDKTAPNVKVKNGVAGEYVSSGLVVAASATVYVQLLDTNADFYTLDGVKVTLIPAISTLEDGLHTVVGYDKAGNFAVATFTVDKTAPLLTLIGKAVSDDGKIYYNADEFVRFFYEDANFAYVKLNGSTITETTVAVSSLTATSYTLEVYDLAGNFARLTFYVDKDAPTVTLKKNAETVDANGVYFKSDQILSITTSDALSGVLTVTLDGDITVFRSWNVSALSDGLHFIRVYDRAGNVAEISFFVDNTPPSFELQGYYKIGDIIDVAYIEANVAQVLFDNSPVLALYFLADELEEGRHFVRITDLAGNVTEKSFIVDLTLPTLTLMKNSVETETEAYLKGGDSFSIQVSDTYLGTVYFDGEPSSVRLWNANNLDERVHTVVVTDLAGNSVTATFTVDKTAPSFDVNEYYLVDETITLNITELNPFTVLLNGVQTSALAFSANALGEALHTVTVIDLAGNATTRTFTVDLSAPLLTLSGFELDGNPIMFESGTSYGALTVVASDIASAKIYYSKDGADFVYTGLYIQIDAYTANSGVWRFYAEDVNGYRTQEITVTLDFSPPTYSLEGITTREGLNAYTNTSFVYSKSNVYAKICYSQNGGGFVYTTAPYIQIDVYTENEGVYTFYTEDAFGRRSEAITVTLSFTFDFKNIENIKDSFKQNTWYKVTLPYRIFGATSKPDISGTYSFADYNTALAFAVAKEKEYRALTVDNGYSYVSVSNEGVYIKYATLAELNAAVLYYAAKYVSERQTFSHLKDRNVYENITNSDFLTDNGALTANALALPNFLSGYSSLPVYLVRKSFIATNNAALSPSSVTLTYLANLNGAVTPFSFTVAYGQTLEAALLAHSNFYEGYYLYIERDLCGNEQCAIVFIDLSEPTLTAYITTGSGTETLTVNKDVVGARSGVFYVTEFRISDLLDNIDGFVGVYITSEKFYGTFTRGDVLPVLNASLGSGKYTITVYDRSFNLLTFDVIVAGNAPSWFYTSLSSSQQSLTLYIYKNDSYTAFTSLKLAKILSDGTYVYLDTDGNGTPISISTTTYVLTAGGKYTCIIEDVYGRRTEFAPIFYEKGLPSGRLVGVSNGGTAKTVVTLDYADTFGLEIFAIAPSGARIPYIGASPSYTASLRTYTATFTPGALETVSYLLILYSLSDPGIYIEYTFTLDTEPPEFLVSDSDGFDVAPNTSTNIPFSLAWGEETATARISKNGGSSSAYAKGTVISANGLYTFTVTDKVGNAAVFTIYLDSEVTFSFGVAPVLIADNIYLSNKVQTITVGEEFKIFSCVDKNGNLYAYGIALDKEGEYTVAIEDLYGNVATFTLLLDFTAPTFILENVVDNLSNKTVTVRTDDVEAVIVEVTSNYVNTKGTIEDGKTYADEGTYYVKVTDRAGNVATIYFIIDKHVDYTANAVNGLITTTAITMKYNENVSQTVILNGAAITPDARYSAPGRYAVEATDLAGNVMSLEFEILPTRVRAFTFSVPEGFTLTRLLKGTETLALPNDGVFVAPDSDKYYITLKHTASGNGYSFDITVDAVPPTVQINEKNNVYSFSRLSKDNVVAALYRDGAPVDDFRLSSALKDKGKYLLVLTDDLGNENTYEFEIANKLNAFSIVLICLGGAALVAGVFLIIKGRKFKAF